jgi:hypothetical protein
MFCQAEANRTDPHPAWRQLMDSQGDISGLVAELKAGKRDAARPLWDAYYRLLMGLARAKLGGLPLRVFDGNRDRNRTRNRNRRTETGWPGNRARASRQADRSRRMRDSLMSSGERGCQSLANRSLRKGAPTNSPLVAQKWRE